MNGIYEYNNSNLRFPSAADIGGRRLLKMGGSLTAYINTGNAYDDHYYVGGKRKFAKKKRNDFPIKDVLKAGIMSAGLIFGAIFLTKGKVNFKKINLDALNNFKIQGFPNIFAKIRNPFKKP